MSKDRNQDNDEQQTPTEDSEANSLSRRQFLGRARKASYVAPTLTVLALAPIEQAAASPPPPPGGGSDIPLQGNPEAIEEWKNGG